MPEPSHTGDSAERLRTLLAAEPPQSVLDLDEADRAALADVLDDARRGQARSMQEAFEASLKHVPFPVRGVVKKVLLG